MDFKNLKVEVEVTNLNELKDLLQKATDLMEQIKNFKLEIKSQAVLQRNPE